MNIKSIYYFLNNDYYFNNDNDKEIIISIIRYICKKILLFVFFLKIEKY